MSTSTIQVQNEQVVAQDVNQAPPAVVANDNTENNDTDGPSRGGNRSFKVKLETNGVLYGRYNGDSPYQAANKALSEIVRNREKNGQIDDGEITFFLVESTKNSSRKQHQYVGRRIKLDVPIEYPVANGITIKKEHKNYLRKVKRTVPVSQPNVATATATATPAVNQPAEPVVLSSDSTTNGNTVSVSV